jgi:hypothetical protein
MTMTLSGTTGGIGVIGSGTAVASTSGTSIDFTSLPAGLKRITVIFNGVSTNGTSDILIRIGSGSVETTGYASSSVAISGSVAGGTNTTGFNIGGGYLAAAAILQGQVVISTIGSNQWTAAGILGRSDTAYAYNCNGSKTASGVIDRVRITTNNGTDTFDAGSINILYE